jgi:hypothetical protein
MSKVFRSTGEATLTADTTSQIISLGDIDYVQVTIVGDMSTGTLTLQQRLDTADTWTAFNYGGTAQDWDNTVLSSATAKDNYTYIIGGCDLRFSLATAGTVTIYVTGKGVFPKATS